MAPIVNSRGNNRAEVSLAMPSSAVLAEDDDYLSPHLNTLQTEKAKTSELQPIFASMTTMTTMPVNGDSTHHHGPGENTNTSESQLLYGGGETNQEQAASGADNAAEEPSAAMPDLVGSPSLDEPPSYIPTNLNYPLQFVDARRNGHDSQATLSGYSNGQATLSGYSSGQATPTGYHSGQATPTGYNVPRRIPSSSIPHLMSASNSLTADPQQLIQTQLSFMGIDAALTPTSRDQLFAFSVDGDDFACKAATRTPPLGVPSHPQAHQLDVCLKQGLAAPLQGVGSGSNRSPSVSLPSVVSPSQADAPYINASPPNPPNLNTPPKKVSCTPIDLNMQLLPQPQLIASPHSSSLEEQLRVINAEVEKILPEVGKEIQTQHATTKPPPLPSHAFLPSHALPPSQHSGNQYQRSSGVQPVLYSAINSLERYNAGSFDNKMMQAKARGTYGTQSAFPGVPAKKTEQSSPLGNGGVDGSGTSTDSRLESNSSSVSSVARKRGPRKGGEKKSGQQEDYTNHDNALIEQVGMEQLVAITGQPSENKIMKSKSSGNLNFLDDGGTPESLGLLKKKKRKKKTNRSVTIDVGEPKSMRGRRREKKVGVFRPSSDAYTPRMGNRDLKYKPAQERASVEKISSTMGTIQRPNFRDALRRVAIILHQHIVKIERRFSTGIRGVDDTGLFKASMREEFDEDNFATPRYKCSMVRIPMARPGVVYSMRKIRVVHNTPTADEIYEFAHQLFKKVQLSSECSIVCLIYVEKLMEVSKVPLVAETWRPIFMCGLLLASKVWQDLSSWNIEFTCVYPQFSLDAINRLELSFLKFIKWDLYISSSLYAKYYFALRSLLEKSGFRDRYNQMVGGIGGIAASEALKVSKRSEAVKEEALQQLSRSM